ncbi:UNVERIFIED_CONTAM: hypothetical protein GTU68_050981 [Idotea baltica]|nr:hypothetical protein [Idotea baltica]
MQIPVRWGDMDSLGHVNNAMYFRYFETVRMEWFEKLREMSPGCGDDGIVIVDNHAEYLLPVVCPATALVRMGGHSPRRSSFVSTYTLIVDGTLTTRGQARIVWVNNHDMKSTPLPPYVRQLVDTEKG